MTQAASDAPARAAAGGRPLTAGVAMLATAVAVNSLLSAVRGREWTLPAEAVRRSPRLIRRGRYASRLRSRTSGRGSKPADL
ncbi:hypothetical protein GCM10010321_03680 [Streptomyces chartreusis]|nr:hypothetical protein GCM10010321_03680 [Streptomyces chartreusis]